MQQYRENIWTHSDKARVEITNDDLESFILSLGNQSIQQLNFQYLAAASALSNNTIIAWFNNQFYHTASLALNLVHNAIVRALIDSEHSIHVTNAPLNFLTPANSTSEDELVTSVFGFSLSFAMGIAMPFVSASYIMFYIQVQYNDRHDSVVP